MLLRRGRLGDGRGENAHPVRRFLARGGGSADEAAVGTVSTVRLAVQTHLIQIQVVIVGHAGAGGSAALRGLGVGGLHKDIPGARQANVVGAGQDDGLPVKGAAHGAFELLFHLIHGGLCGGRLLCWREKHGRDV